MYPITYLGKYPEMDFYMFIYKYLKLKIPKILWYKILKDFVEMNDLAILLNLLKYNDHLYLRIQPTSNIFSTIFYKPINDTFIKSDTYAYNYYVIPDDDNNLIIDNTEIDLSQLCDVELNYKDKFFFKQGSYIGQIDDYILDGKMYAHGYGLCFFHDSVYQGFFEHGHIKGFGKILYNNGNIYIGQTNKKRHGQGTLTFSNGHKYIGSFKNGHYHGFGTEYNNDDHLIYQGEYKNDEYHGIGTQYELSVSYKGEFQHGLRHGSGILYYTDYHAKVTYEKGRKKQMSIIWKKS